ncbi:tRNA lysidine(34) synthetase TilS [Jiella sonneratiae]|uniref:tRNA(Ile)-lysidine synthase n=1 Tax=Jiella sonneratiae TaxID=2816856 RepID=A0ABS3J466_9HYPH|nr:tRNA lysidine(34) synthetase TilS [Jiella sonneratiae]MBO0904454.1 tRNA lysidine(34) synthetase TilS [Jiella sonneratiae]
MAGGPAATPQPDAPGGDPRLAASIGAVIAAAEQRLGRLDGLLLAVSGGPDSLALMLAAAGWQERNAASARLLRVATVDHRLRPESSAEAAFVAGLAASLGLAHDTLPWTGWDGTGNLAASAREARYRLLLDHARTHRLGLVLVAHHRDDDLETHLLRRARGGGLAALAGMRPLRWLGPDVLLGRPFLDMPQSVLKGAVAAGGIVPVDDPSNRDMRSDRARIRRELAVDAGLRQRALRGLGRAKRARAEGEAALAALLADLQDTGRLRYADDGAVLLDRAVLAGLPKRCAAQLLSRAIVAASGSPAPPPGRGVRDLLGRLAEDAGPDLVATLGGAVVEARESDILLRREYGRCGIADLAVGGATRLIGRFADELPAPVVFDGRLAVGLGQFAQLPGARLVAYGSLGLGGPRQKCLPVLVDAAGRPKAAAAAVAPRLGPDVAPLAVLPLAPHLLRRDLPPADGLTASSP